MMHLEPDDEAHLMRGTLSAWTLEEDELNETQRIPYLAGLKYCALKDLGWVLHGEPVCHPRSGSWPNGGR